jgi:hypothetical protein
MDEGMYRWTIALRTRLFITALRHRSTLEPGINVIEAKGYRTTRHTETHFLSAQMQEGTVYSKINRCAVVWLNISSMDAASWKMMKEG